MKKFIAALLVSALGLTQTAVFAEEHTSKAGNSASGMGIMWKEERDWTTVSDWAWEYVDKYLNLNLMPATMGGITDYTVDITRIQLCDMIERLIEKKRYDNSGYDIDVFEDCDRSSANILNYLGIIKGTSETTFEPDRILTREEAAVIFTRLCEYTNAYVYDQPYQIYRYKDESEFAGWSKDAIYAMYEAKIMGGTGDNNFSPKGTYTIEQAIKTIYELYDMIPEAEKKRTIIDDLIHYGDIDNNIEYLSDGYYAIRDGDAMYISTTKSVKDRILGFIADEFVDMDYYKHDGILYLAVNMADGTAKLYKFDNESSLLTIPYNVEKLAFDYIIIEDKSAESAACYGVWNYDYIEILKPEHTIMELSDGGYLGTGSSSGNRVVSDGIQ